MKARYHIWVIQLCARTFLPEPDFSICQWMECRDLPSQRDPRSAGWRVGLGEGAFRDTWDGDEHSVVAGPREGRGCQMLPLVWVGGGGGGGGGGEKVRGRQEEEREEEGEKEGRG